MRYTRFEFKVKGDESWRKILKLFVMVPVIGIMSGFLVYKWVIAPHISRSTELSGSSVAEMQGEYKFQAIENRKYYIVQAGIFTSPDNANVFCQKLKSLGFPAAIVKVGQYNGVMLWPHWGRDYVDSKAMGLRREGFECIIKEIHVNPDKLPENLKSDNKYILLCTMIERAGEAIDKYLNALAGIDKGDQNNNVLKEDAVAAVEMLDQAASQFRTVDATGSFKGLTGKIATISKHIEEANEKMDNFSIYSPEGIINSIFLFKEIIDEYNEKV